jgi:hypothetical protein
MTIRDSLPVSNISLNSNKEGETTQFPRLACHRYLVFGRLHPISGPKHDRQTTRP